MKRSSEVRVGPGGAGSRETAVAALAGANTPTMLRARRPDLVGQVAAARVDLDHLPAHTLPDLLPATSSLDGALRRRGGDGYAVARVPRCRRRGSAPPPTVGAEGRPCR